MKVSKAQREIIDFLMGRRFYMMGFDTISVPGAVVISGTGRRFSLSADGSQILETVSGQKTASVIARRNGNGWAVDPLYYYLR